MRSTRFRMCVPYLDIINLTDASEYRIDIDIVKFARA